MSDAPVVDSAAFELRASRKKLAEDIRASERDLKASMGQIERDADKGAKSIGASIGRMATVAVTAVTALVTVLGMAAAGHWTSACRACGWPTTWPTRHGKSGLAQMRFRSGGT